MAALSADDYAGLIEGLTPSGPAWQDATLRSVWAVELARLDARIWKLFDEADPRTATELLTDWERVLGLPDECMAELPLSINERRLIAWQRLTEIGGQSRAYFIDLAARFGEPGVSISEFRPMTCNDHCNDALYGQVDRFVWRVNIPRPAESVRLMNCNDDCNDALQMYAASLAECPLEERKPAHTNVIFSYQE